MTWSRALATPRCLDVAITADPVDPTRINIFERWESRAAVETLRSSGPSNEHGSAMLSVSVAEYDIVNVRPLFGGRPSMNLHHEIVTGPMRAVPPPGRTGR